MANVIESPNGIARIKLGSGWITLTGGGASQVGNAILRVPDLQSMYTLSPELYLNDICVVVDLMRVYQYLGPDPALETSWDLLSGQYFNIHEVALPAHLGNLNPQQATQGDLAYITETTELKALYGDDPSDPDNWVYLASRPKLWNAVQNQEEMLALKARRGDFAVRTDLNAPEGQTWYLNGDDPSNLYDWFLMPGGNPIGDESWEHAVSVTEPPRGPDGILWLNPEEVPPLSGTSLLFDLDALIDVDLSTNPPTNLSPLVYNESRKQWVPGSASAEVFIGLDDPSPTEPGTELWFHTEATPPPTPAPLWDATVTYLQDDEVSWPDPAVDTWKAIVPFTTGQEPGIPVPVLDAYQFKGGTGAVEGLSADVAASILNFGAGCDFRIQTHNGLSNGFLISVLDVVDNVAIALEVDSAATRLAFHIRTTTTPITAPFYAPFANFDVANRPWIRVVADPSAKSVTFYDSVDGVTWAVAGAPLVSADPFAVPATNEIRIGNERLTPAKNYSGALVSVETYQFIGTRATAWIATELAGAAPGEDGTGNVPGSTETYTATNPGSFLTPITHTYDPWEVVPPYVPPIVPPGVLRARVIDEWEDIGGAGAFLPLTGGKMEPGGVIRFHQEVGNKIILYDAAAGSQFGLAIQSGELRLFVEQAANKIGFTVGTTQRAMVNQSGVVATANHGLFLGDAWHGWIYNSTDNGEHLRSYQGKWQFRQTNGSAPGTLIAEVNTTAMYDHGRRVVTETGNQNVDLNDVSANNITAAGITHTTSSQTGFSVIAGSNGSNSNHYYVNCDTNDGGGYYFNVLEARRQDNKTVFQLKGCQYEVASNGVVEAQAQMYVSKGSEGTDQVSAWKDYGDGQSTLEVYGPCKASHFHDVNRSSAIAGTDAPVDPDLVGRLIDAVQPITFSRTFRPKGMTDANEPGFVRPEHDPIPTLGLDIDGIENDYADRMRGPEPGGYSMGGMLAVAVAEIKSLRARVAELESHTPAPRKKRG